jgi:hypothetical protein
MVEYAVGLGCVTALGMVALGALGFLDFKILHGMEHAFFPGHSGPTSPHGTAITNTAAQPWVLQ